MRWHVNLSNLCAFHLKFCFCVLPSMVYVHAVPCGGVVEPERRGGWSSWGGRCFGVGRELRASPAAGSVFSLYCLFTLEEERMKQPQVLIHLQIIFFQLRERKAWFWALFLTIYGLFELGYMNSYSNIFPVSFPGLLGGCISQCLWKMLHTDSEASVRTPLSFGIMVPYYWYLLTPITLVLWFQGSLKQY